MRLWVCNQKEITLWVAQCSLAIFCCSNGNNIKSKCFAVIENGLCKQLCLKIIPEVSGVVHSIEVDNVIEPDSNMVERQYANLECLKRNHKVYSCLAFGLFPLKNNCISQYMVASRTIDPMKEGVANTLAAIYKPENDPKTLFYRLCSKICLVTEINILPFQG